MLGLATRTSNILRVIFSSPGQRPAGIMGWRSVRQLFSSPEPKAQSEL